MQTGRKASRPVVARGVAQERIKVGTAKRQETAVVFCFLGGELGEASAMFGDLTRWRSSGSGGGD